MRRVIEPLLSGGDESRYSSHDLEYVRDLGLIARDDPPRIANPIYAEVAPRELTYAAQASLLQDAAWYVDAEGAISTSASCSPPSVLLPRVFGALAGRFDYVEAGPQLVLQAFVQRVVNSGGRIEREYGLGRGCTDLLIIWPHGGGATAMAGAHPDRCPSAST